jgi:hypothetical protein
MLVVCRIDVGEGFVKAGNVQHNQHRRQINRRPRRSQSGIKSKEGVFAILKNHGTEVRHGIVAFRLAGGPESEFHCPDQGGEEGGDDHVEGC